MREFTSFLAPQLQAYREFKTAWGFTTFAQDHRLGDLDSYASLAGLRSLDQVNKDFVLRWMNSRQERAAASKNRLLGFARGFFDYLVRHGYMTDNPAHKITPLKAVTAPPYIYSLLEIQQILEACGKRPVQRYCPLSNQTLETMIFLIYACGLRISEAVKIKIQDVDWEDNVLALWNTKFHKERLVPFSPEVAQKLKTYLGLRRKVYALVAGPEAPFFCHAKGQYHAHGIQSQFRRILIKAGLSKGGKGPRIHDLRHTFAVHRLYKWYQDGYDILNKLPLLSIYMGHVTIENTQVYLRITTALLREGNRRFRSAFEDIAQRPIRRIFKSRKRP